MAKKISPQIMRTIFFVLGILCYATGYAFFTEKGYGGSFSSLITIAGMFFILNSFTYKTKESELKLHSFIQKGTNNFSEKAIMLLSFMFIAFFIVIAYMIYSKILKQEYVGRDDYVVSLCAGILLLFGFSLWEKWRFLKSK
ncbi:MAG: hypothetical protein WBI17_03155 [Clostridiaceae bacterium]